MDPWNLMDFFGQIMYAIFSIYDLLRKAGKVEFNYFFENLMILSLLLLLARAVALLRIFSNTRYLIRMILIVIIDMKSFIIIQIVFVVIFSIIF